MKKKLTNIIFILIFMACLIVPAIFLNTKEMQISNIDNKLLTEWPGLDLTLSNKDIVENYVDDRIGFRENAIEAYTELNDKLFHVMVHPLFMYGKEGQIYYKDPTYIKGYQRMNTDKPYLDTFVDFLSRSEKYLSSKDIDFLYYLCPDKKTIYPEYFPDSIHVNEANVSLIQYMKEKLDETDIDYIIPDKELTEAKANQVVYNKLYDATHWNEDGAFIGHELIDEKIQEKFDDVKPLTKDDYAKSMEKITTLDVAKFTIDEDIPHYALQNDTSMDMTMYLHDYLAMADNTFFSHFTNPESGNNRILLVFTDSYFGNYHKFYQNRFREVYFVHWHNYKYLQYYVNLFFPDMVIFETAERSITGEMIGLNDEDGNRLSTIEYTDIYYEEPYTIASGNEYYDLNCFSSDNSNKPGYILTEIKGVSRDGTLLGLNVNEGDSIVSINGYIDSDKDYKVYANLAGEKWVECDFDELHELSKESGLNQFSINIQRRYLMEEDIMLVAVGPDTKETYILDTLNVRYEQ